MTRPIAVEADADGSARLRIRIPPNVWGIATAYASRIGVKPEVAAKILLEQIDALISTGSIAWLSADWQTAARGSKAAPEIDHTKLHRSDRTKSGYAGVYANGAGFRATGRAGAYIGTYPSAEVAAWERYLYYMRNDLPYGELEVAVDEERKCGTKGTDAELREIVLDTARKSGTAHLYEASGPIQMAGFGPGGIEEASAKLHLHDAETEQPRTGRPLTGKRK